MGKAQVGISSVWYSGNPCNMHLMDLNHLVKKGVEQAGMVGMQFNTVGVSDAISMGTSGMRYSLQSRDLIADSIEVSYIHIAHAVADIGLDCDGGTMVRREHLYSWV